MVIVRIESQRGAMVSMYLLWYLHHLMHITAAIAISFLTTSVTRGFRMVQRVLTTSVDTGLQTSIQSVASLAITAHHSTRITDLRTTTMAEILVVDSIK
jgi:hypothetical protein